MMKPKPAIETPKTQGIKYAGSKLRLIPYILRLAAETGAESVFDGFAGTTRVSQAFAQTGYRVFSNDTAVWSKTLALCYLKNNRPTSYYRQLIEHLNHVQPRNGWFTETYGGDGKKESSIGADGLKKPFQRHNTRKLDAVREEIDRLRLGTIEKSVLLTSLILGLDKVDNTIGHYASYLNNWSPRSYKELTLEVPNLFKTRNDHQVLQGDVFESINEICADLAYFDPPYGSNNEKMPPSRVRYASYYHIWTSVILNDQPETFGKAKRRSDSRDLNSCSVFEEFRANEDGGFIAVEALRMLINNAGAKHIILSYSSGGRATAENLLNIIQDSGEIIEFVKVDYKRNVMASMKWTGEWVSNSKIPNEEFLFLVKKNGDTEN